MHCLWVKSISFPNNWSLKPYTFKNQFVMLYYNSYNVDIGSSSTISATFATLIDLALNQASKESDNYLLITIYRPIQELIKQKMMIIQISRTCPRSQFWQSSWCWNDNIFLSPNWLDKMLLMDIRRCKMWQIFLLIITWCLIQWTIIAPPQRIHEWDWTV